MDFKEYCDEIEVIIILSKSEYNVSTYNKTKVFDLETFDDIQIRFFSLYFCIEIIKNLRAIRTTIITPKGRVQFNGKNHLNEIRKLLSE